MSSSRAFAGNEQGRKIPSSPWVGCVFGFLNIGLGIAVGVVFWRITASELFVSLTLDRNVCATLKE